jgi:hypothetical protein
MVARKINAASHGVHQRAETAVTDPASGDLRAQITKGRFGETHVVGNDLKDFLIGLFAAVEF